MKHKYARLLPGYQGPLCLTGIYYLTGNLLEQLASFKVTCDCTRLSRRDGCCRLGPMVGTQASEDMVYNMESVKEDLAS